MRSTGELAGVPARADQGDSGAVLGRGETEGERTGVGKGGATVRQLATAADGVALEVGISGLGGGYLREDGQLVMLGPDSAHLDMAACRHMAWERQVKRRCVDRGHNDACECDGRWSLKWETYP